MRSDHPRDHGPARKFLLDLSLLSPLVLLFASSLKGTNAVEAFHRSAQLFISPFPGIVVWLQVLLLDLGACWYAFPILKLHSRCASGDCAPPESEVDLAMRRLDRLSFFIIPAAIVCFAIGGAARTISDMASLSGGIPARSLALGMLESAVNGLFSGVILSLGFENKLFAARATLLDQGPRRRLHYSSLFSKLMLAMMSIALFLTVQIFSSASDFFSLGLAGKDGLGRFGGEAAPLTPLGGAEFLLHYGRNAAVKQALDVFALRMAIYAIFIVQLILQLKQLIKRPLATVADRLKALNAPSLGGAKAIDILKNDEFAKVYELINALIRRQESEIEDSRQRLESVIESAADPILSVDATGSIRLFNPAAEAAFGYRASEAIGKPLGLVLPEAGVAQEAGAAGAPQDGISRGLWRRADGSSVPMEAHASAGGEGERAWTTMVLRDVSLQAEIEASLTRARVDAENASRMKSEFLANMSHELRTPLNAILGFTQLMAGDRNLTDAQRDRIGVISRSGEHLLALINDILDISKIEAGKMELHPVAFDLPRFVEDLGRMFELKCRKSGLALYVESLDSLPRYVEADLGKLRQVMINLLGNAVKFTSEGGVSLLVGRDDSQAGVPRIRFAVRDTGRGIPADELELIMQPFVQASTTDHEGGTGLGLAISSRYIAMMGGRLEVESELGEGSTFSFSLELPERSSPAEGEPEDEAPIAVARGSEATALVVDDQYANRLVLKEMLERAGFSVIEARDGKEAVATARESGPDIIFMDIKMPVMDGFEAVAALKGDPATAPIRVFALTASAFSHDEARIMAAGFDGFLAKPFKLASLYRLIREKGAVALEAPAARPPSAPAGEIDFAAAAAALGEAGIAELEAASLINDFGGIAARAGALGDAAPAFAASLREAADSYDEERIASLLGRLRASGLPGKEER